MSGNLLLSLISRSIINTPRTQADNSATCLVPEFVRSLAALLSASRHLVHYQQMPSNSASLKELLSPQNCIRDSMGAFVNGIIEPLRQLCETGKLGNNKQFIILLDSLGKSLSLSFSTEKQYFHF